MPWNNYARILIFFCLLVPHPSQTHAATSTFPKTSVGPLAPHETHTRGPFTNTCPIGMHSEYFTVQNFLQHRFLVPSFQASFMWIRDRIVRREDSTYLCRYHIGTDVGQTRQAVIKLCSWALAMHGYLTSEVQARPCSNKSQMCLYPLH